MSEIILADFLKKYPLIKTAENTYESGWDGRLLNISAIERRLEISGQQVGGIELSKYRRYLRILHEVGHFAISKNFDKCNFGLPSDENDASGKFYWVASYEEQLAAGKVELKILAFQENAKIIFTKENKVNGYTPQYNYSAEANSIFNNFMYHSISIKEADEIYQKYRKEYNFDRFWTNFTVRYNLLLKERETNGD